MPAIEIEGLQDLVSRLSETQADFDKNLYGNGEASSRIVEGLKRL